MITVEALSKKYGAFTAVDDVSFTAQAGRVTGFLGPNGAGKSTTMRVMVGLTPPTSGSATVLGRSYADLLSDEIWSRIGAEGDAAISIVPASGATTAHAGLSARLRDLT